MDSLIDSVSFQLINIIPRIMQTIVAGVHSNSESRLPMVHLRILHILTQQTMRVSDLAIHENVTKASISVSVKILVEKGWVRRVEDTSDHRVSFLEVTEEGRRVLDEIQTDLTSTIQENLGQLPDSELTIIASALDILSGTFYPEQRRESFRKN